MFKLGFGLTASLVALIAQASTPPLDIGPYSVFGVAGVTVAIAIGGWRLEKQRADKAQEQLVELVREVSTLGQQQLSATQAMTRVTEGLAAEVRRLGDNK